MTAKPVERPVLATLPHIELMHAGTWDISTGQATFTPDDLRAACSALDCPAVRRPVLKLGHVDARFDGEPAVGWVANMSTDGTTMWGDYTGMPRWLAEVAASAYPDRSIEGWYDYKCQIGHTHPFVLTAVALLGVTPPGIGTLESLQDVAALYGVAAAQDGGVDSQKITLTVEGHHAMPTAVHASATVEDVRRAFYEDAPYSVWITEIQLDPPQLIVTDDETGAISRVPYKVDPAQDGDEAISFEAAVPVVVRYEDLPSSGPQENPMAASAHGRVHYASRADSRPLAAPSLPATEPEVSNQKEVAMGDNILRERLGLSPEEEYTDEQLAAAWDAKVQEEAGKLAAAAGAPKPGQVLVSAARMAQLEDDAAKGKWAAAKLAEQERDATLEEALRVGKISAARRADWAKAWDVDPEGTKADLASLPANRIPMAAKGHLGDESESNEDATYSVLFPDDSKEA